MQCGVHRTMHFFDMGIDHDDLPWNSIPSTSEFSWLLRQFSVFRHVVVSVFRALNVNEQWIGPWSFAS